MGNKEQSLSELAQDAMQLHSMLEDEWLLSTMTIDEGTEWCHDRSAVENKCPTLKPLTLCPPHLLECYGEHMFMPSTLRQLTIE